MKTKNTFLTTISRALILFVMLPTLTVSISGCSDDEENINPNEIKNLPETVAVNASEDENTVALKFTAQLAWTATYADEESEWFSFTPESGVAGEAIITITAPYNEGAAKTGKLTIKHGTNTYTVTINQKAGKPDMATWEKTGLLQNVFAPDAYNATEENPAKFVISVTTTQDYDTLNKAPFEIMTFHADEAGIPTDSVINWVNVNIVEGSPTAKDGKKLEVTVDTIAVNIKDIGSTPDDRYAFFCIVPRGTQKADMFDGKEIKEEFKEMGTYIQQANYNFIYTGSSFSIIDAGPQVTPDETSRTFTVTSNCKYDVTTIMPDMTPKGWWKYSINTNKKEVTFTSDNTIPRATTPATMGCMINLYFYIDRGPDMQQIVCNRRPYLPIMMMYARSY